MLAVKTYPQDHIDRCRDRMESQLATYQLLVAAAGTTGSGVVATFEPQFTAHLVMTLDAYFMHRARGVEGKNGNPLNEVRLMSAALLDGDGTFQVDSTIKYDPATAVIGLEVGEQIQLDLEQFTALFHAYFAELEARYS